MPTGSASLAHLSAPPVSLPLHAAPVPLDSASTDLTVLLPMPNFRESPSLSKTSAEEITLSSSLLDSTSSPTVFHPLRGTTSSWLCPILETESTSSISGNPMTTSSLWLSPIPLSPLSLQSSSQSTPSRSPARTPLLDLMLIQLPLSQLPSMPDLPLLPLP